MVQIGHNATSTEPQELIWDILGSVGEWDRDVDSSATACVFPILCLATYLCDTSGWGIRTGLVAYLEPGLGSCSLY